MADEITLYDLPSNGKCASWSLNPWKTRAALNFKEVPYKTEWTEYPDIEPKFKSFGISANDSSQNPTPYSIPAVRLPDGRYIMDSRAIADALEKLHPSPSLHLDNGYLDKTQDLVLKLVTPLRAKLMPDVPALLNERSAKYFESTRAERFGMSLSELAKSKDGGEAAWQNAAEPIDAVKKLLAENDGPFIAGEAVSYADFILGGLWIFTKKIDEQSFARLVQHNQAFEKHWEAVSKYFKREDH